MFTGTVMDFRTVVTISALFLMTTGAQVTSHPRDTNMTSVPAPNSNQKMECTCPSTAPATSAAPDSNPRSSGPALGLFTVNWIGNCKGDLILQILPNSSFPVCRESERKVQSLFTNVCKSKKGCKEPLRWDKGQQKQTCYHITDSDSKPEDNYETLTVQCTVDAPRPPEDQGQLRTYKVVTALLCCVLLVLLLIRFTRPTVNALQKRLSNRRQNRWIGPTQSHSVSYHRGKTAVKNHDGEKRLSYPALERLAVSDSREPSSNRNSDYNL
ncbi:T-cell surface glycoprotein CD5 [Toxotes jaculatrix]|uniref:T-cell surface glycoprotein CD5 n=1 Tax=Toxotes jaculatrix TaxID=941984 RepID=UPI001B3AF5A6|nr:T-cell surface glycoprotein CD5 [Toxotes jaculatrix]